MKMKIAYICTDLGIQVLGSKGASIHVREFTDALVELGHEVRIYAAAGADPRGTGDTPNSTRAPLTVLAPSTETASAAEQMAGAIARLDEQNLARHLRAEFSHLLADGEFAAAALPLLADFQPDLLIARYAIFSVAPLELARTLGCPVVLEVNAPLIEERRLYWGLALEQQARQAERRLFAGVDLLVAVSEGVRDYLLGQGAPPERIALLPNGVNLHDFHLGVDGAAVRRRYGLQDRVVIGFAGSLKPWHGVDLLLHAFAAVQAEISTAGLPPRSGPELHLLIMGDGPERERLLRLAADLNIGDSTTFTAALPHAAMPEHLAALDIAVAPYLASDGFYFSPLKVMEYLAMGRAVVAPRLGQIPALLAGAGGPCGLLYEPDSQTDLARALLRLVRDEGLRRTLGERAAREARLRHSWAEIARQIVARGAGHPECGIRDVECGITSSRGIPHSASHIPHSIEAVVR
jgi:glycosyltransferase involved in cell wall biosynthesis